MGVLFVGGLLIGIFLGRIFKVLVLVPAGCIGVFLVCMRSAELGDNFLLITAEVVVLMTSLQIGYILAALTIHVPSETGVEIPESRVTSTHPRSAFAPARMTPAGRKSWVAVASAALRSVHLR